MLERYSHEIVHVLKILLCHVPVVPGIVRLSLGLDEGTPELAYGGVGLEVLKMMSLAYLAIKPDQWPIPLMAYSLFSAAQASLN